MHGRVRASKLKPGVDPAWRLVSYRACSLKCDEPLAKLCFQPLPAAFNGLNRFQFVRPYSMGGFQSGSMVGLLAAPAMLAAGTAWRIHVFPRHQPRFRPYLLELYPRFLT